MTYEKYLEIIKLPEEEQRKFFIENSHEEFTIVSTNDNYFYIDEKKIAWGGKRIICYTIKSTGFCIKDNKIYFRNAKAKTIINNYYFVDKDYNIDWFPKHLRIFLSPGLFKNIVQKKITNPKQALQYIAKYFFRDKTLYPKAIDTLARHIDSTNDYSPLLRHFPKLFNFNALSQINYRELNYFNFAITIKNAFLLNEKFNIKWSRNRLNRWNRNSIRKTQADVLDNYYKEKYIVPDLILPDGYDVIRNSADLYIINQMFEVGVFYLRHQLDSNMILIVNYKKSCIIRLFYNKKEWCVKDFYSRNGLPMKEQKIFTDLMDEVVIPQLEDTVSKITYPDIEREEFIF